MTPSPAHTLCFSPLQRIFHLPHCKLVRSPEHICIAKGFDEHLFSAWCILSKHCPRNWGHRREQNPQSLPHRADQSDKINSDHGKCLKKIRLFWLVWLSGLSTSLRTKGSLVRFPVRECAWVAGQVPSRACARGNHTLMFLTLSFSLPSPLSKNK